MMKYQIGEKTQTKMQSSQEGLDALDAVESFYAIASEITEASEQFNAAIDVMTNICDSLEHLEKFGEKGIKDLNVDGGLEALLGVSAEQITVASAQEGLGEAFKNAVEAIRKWLESIISRVKEFFSKTQTSPSPKMAEAAATIKKEEEKAGGTPKAPPTEAAKPAAPAGEGEAKKPEDKKPEDNVAKAYFEPQKKVLLSEKASIVSSNLLKALEAKEFTKITDALGKIATSQKLEELEANRKAADPAFENALVIKTLGFQATAPSGKLVGAEKTNDMDVVLPIENQISVKDAGWESLSKYAQTCLELDIAASELLKEEAATVGKMEADCKKELETLKTAHEKEAKFHARTLKDIVNSYIKVPVHAAKRLSSVQARATAVYAVLDVIEV